MHKGIVKLAEEHWENYLGEYIYCSCTRFVRIALYIIVNLAEEFSSCTRYIKNAIYILSQKQYQNLFHCSRTRVKNIN